MQLLWATMMIKGSLLLSAPIVKHFHVFWANIWRFWGIDRGFNIKFKFYNLEEAHPCVISRDFSYIARKTQINGSDLYGSLRKKV